MWSTVMKLFILDFSIIVADAMKIRTSIKKFPSLYLAMLTSYFFEVSYLLANLNAELFLFVRTLVLTTF